LKSIRREQKKRIIIIIIKEMPRSHKSSHDEALPNIDNIEYWRRRRKRGAEEEEKLVTQINAEEEELW